MKTVNRIKQLLVEILPNLLGTITDGRIGFKDRKFQGGADGVWNEFAFITDIPSESNKETTDQIEVYENTTATAFWHGKVILVRLSCTINIPATLIDNFTFNYATLEGVTLTLAITTPKTWLFGAPTTIPEKSIGTITQRGSTDSIMHFK